MAGRPLSSARSELRDRAVLYGYIAMGSVIGGWARYLVFLAQIAWLGPGFPWATLFVNVTGSFVIGFYAAITAPDGRVFASSRQRQLVMTGICGGYTTFSGFSYETFELLRTGHALAALINLGISPVTWLLAVWIGHIAATRLNRLKGS
jgi:CrcB protein